MAHKSAAVTNTIEVEKPHTDGRRERSRSSRRAIIHAMMDLIVEGDFATRPKWRMNSAYGGCRATVCEVTRMGRTCAFGGRIAFGLSQLKSGVVQPLLEFRHDQCHCFGQTIREGE